MTFSRTRATLRGPGRNTHRGNKYNKDLLHPTGWLREGGKTCMFVSRPDSRSQYLPRIDIPGVHGAEFGPPENLYELHADMALRRSQSVPPIMRPPYPSPATLHHRRADFNRTGNHLSEWRTGPLSQYQSVLPYGDRVQGSALPHPGQLLPAPLLSSQGLFGPTPHREGVPTKLRAVAASMPPVHPRFMIHDVSSCSASTHAHFFKTNVAPGANYNPSFLSTNNFSYPAHEPSALRSSNFGAKGVKTESFGKTYEASGQQPWTKHGVVGATVG